jgi:hypothetical protein
MKWFGNFVEPPWPVGIGWSLLSTRCVGRKEATPEDDYLTGKLIMISRISLMACSSRG